MGTNAFKECDNLTIYTYKGSYAQTYGNDNNIKVVLLAEFLLGDVNDDGKVTW